MIVENLPAPFDRRVWQEANTLAAAGAKVSIICPKMKGYMKSFETINGIDIYRHPLYIEAKGALGYLLEYANALVWEFMLGWWIFFKKRFDVVFGCNPPDLIFLVALTFRPFGVKFIFDHHDINPELYFAKYRKKDFFYRFLLWLERLTFSTADFSIATNESYREIAITRGKMSPERISVIRSGPNLERLKPAPGNDKYKKGRNYLVGYVGVIGAQEGLDLLLESIGLIVDKRRDVQFAIIGDGTELVNIMKKTYEMGLEEYVDYYGRVDDATMIDVLSTADVCVNPDRPTEMNNLSTMNKIMEYMALKKPIVQYDLKEGRFSAEHASLYACNTSTEDFAHKITWLLDHPEDRIRRGEYGYHKIVNELSWDHESSKLVDFFKKVFSCC
jgi:Glycosyltransferase